jgi:hypothetical protein
MIDFAEGRVLYRLGSQIRSLALTSRTDTLLLQGAAAATLDTHGLGWAHGNSVSFACASCLP